MKKKENYFKSDAIQIQLSKLLFFHVKDVQQIFKQLDRYTPPIQNIHFPLWWGYGYFQPIENNVTTVDFHNFPIA